MAATVVVYLERNLEAADAVAVTASRHPSMQQLDPRRGHRRAAAAGRRARSLLGNALMADVSGPAAGVGEAAAADGRRASWTRLAAPGRRAARDPGQPDAGRAGRRRARRRARLSDHVSDDRVVGVLALSVHLEALERFSDRFRCRPARSSPSPTSDSIVLARSLEPALYVGRPIDGAGPATSPADVPASVVISRHRRHRARVRQRRGRTRAVAGQRRHSHRGGAGAHRADLRRNLAIAVGSTLVMLAARR